VSNRRDGPHPADRPAGARDPRGCSRLADAAAAARCKVSGPDRPSLTNPAGVAYHIQYVGVASDSRSRARPSQQNTARSEKGRHVGRGVSSTVTSMTFAANDERPCEGDIYRTLQFWIPFPDWYADSPISY